MLVQKQLEGLKRRGHVSIRIRRDPKRERRVVVVSLQSIVNQKCVPLGGILSKQHFWNSDHLYNKGPLPGASAGQTHEIRNSSAEVAERRVSFAPACAHSTFHSLCFHLQIQSQVFFARTYLKSTSSQCLQGQESRTILRCGGSQLGSHTPY